MKKNTTAPTPLEVNEGKQDTNYDLGFKEGYHSALNEIEYSQKWEVHKQRKSGIGNTGYGYAILMPLITKEGEYKGQLGGYHVIADQDIGLSKEFAEGICKDHNTYGASAPQLKAENETLKEANRELLEALTVALHYRKQTHFGDDFVINKLEAAISKHSKQTT